MPSSASASTPWSKYSRIVASHARLKSASAIAAAARAAKGAARGWEEFYEETPSTKAEKYFVLLLIFPFRVCARRLGAGLAFFGPEAPVAATAREGDGLRDARRRPLPRPRGRVLCEPRRNGHR